MGDKGTCNCNSPSSRVRLFGRYQSREALPWRAVRVRAGEVGGTLPAVRVVLALRASQSNARVTPILKKCAFFEVFESSEAIGHQAIGANTHPPNSERFVHDALERQEILGLLEQRPSSDCAVQHMKDHSARHFSFWSSHGRASYQTYPHSPNLVAVTFSFSFSPFLSLHLLHD